MNKPTVKLIGTDGNTLCILGRCTKALRDSGQPEKAKELSQKVFEASSYNQALQMCLEFVEAE